MRLRQARASDEIHPTHLSNGAIGPALRRADVGVLRQVLVPNRGMMCQRPHGTQLPGFSRSLGTLDKLLALVARFCSNSLKQLCVFATIVTSKDVALVIAS